MILRDAGDGDGGDDAGDDDDDDDVGDDADDEGSSDRRCGLRQICRWRM